MYNQDNVCYHDNDYRAIIASKRKTKSKTMNQWNSLAKISATVSVINENGAIVRCFQVPLVHRQSLTLSVSSTSVSCICQFRRLSFSSTPFQHTPSLITKESFSFPSSAFSWKIRFACLWDGLCDSDWPCLPMSVTWLLNAQFESGKPLALVLSKAHPIAPFGSYPIAPFGSFLLRYFCAQWDTASLATFSIEALPVTKHWERQRKKNWKKLWEDPLNKSNRTTMRPLGINLIGISICIWIIHFLMISGNFGFLDANGHTDAHTDGRTDWQTLI